MNTTSVTYNSFAFPPNGIFVGRTYEFGKDDGKYFVSSCGKFIYLQLEEIKSLFTPIDKTWEEVLAPVVNKNVKKIGNGR